MSQISMLNPEAHARFLENLGMIDRAVAQPRARRNPHKSLALDTNRWKGYSAGPDPEVLVLREYLIRIMPTDPTVTVLSPVLNTFDGTLDAAVKAFQAANGLTVDGAVGPNTWLKLDAQIVGKPSLDAVLATRGSRSGAAPAASGGAPPESANAWLTAITKASTGLTGITQGLFQMQLPAGASAATMPGGAPVSATTTPPPGTEQPDNTLLYVGLAVGGLVVLGGTVFLLTRK